MCVCSTSPSFVARGTQPDRFAESLVFVVRNHLGMELRRCTDCGQHWRVDVFDGHGEAPGDSVKVPSAEGWTEFDARSFVLEHMLRSRGGTSSETCAWHACTRRAMKRAAYCVEHAYALGHRR